MKFCKGDENLEDEECNGLPLKVDNNQLEQSSKLILLQLHEKLPKKWMLTFLQSCGILSKCWKVEKLVKWVPHELTTNQKLVILKHHILLFYTTTMNHFSIELWPVMKSGFYMTTGDDQLSGGTEKKLQSTSQSQTCCQSDPLQFSESQQNHYIWEVCSANHWDALKTATRAVGIGQQKGANSSPWQRVATHHTSNAS